MKLNELKDLLFARGTTMGFTDMEVYYLSNSRFNANIFKGEIDRYTVAVDGGLSFRGRIGEKMGYAYTELVDESAVDALLEGAKNGAGVIDSEEVEPLFEGPFTYEEADLYNPAIDQATAEEKIALLKALEAECSRLDSRVSLVNFCQMEAQTYERMIASTKGLYRTEKATRCFIMVSVVVREGSETKNAMKFWPIRDLGSFDVKTAAKAAVDEAISYLGAEPVESGAYPILLRNTAASNLLATFAGVFYATNTQKGRSLMKGRLGQVVASEVVSLIDDPFLPGGAESRSFDSEGVPSRRMALVDNGKLGSFLYNLKSAKVDGVASTGHGHKPSYKGAINVAPSNLYLKPGNRSFEEQVAGLKEGLIITSLQGLHSGANPISGDFSLAASGYYVENGKFVRPVNQITVAGNFYSLLKEIEEVGADLEFSPGHGGYVGSPTIRIKSLAVAGK